jgi:hypothetical protein
MLPLRPPPPPRGDPRRNVAADRRTRPHHLREPEL